MPCMRWRAQYHGFRFTLPCTRMTQVTWRDMVRLPLPQGSRGVRTRRSPTYELILYQIHPIKRTSTQIVAAQMSHHHTGSTKGVIRNCIFSASVSRRAVTAWREPPDPNSHTSTESFATATLTRRTISSYLRSASVSRLVRAMEIYLRLI